VDVALDDHLVVEIEPGRAHLALDHVAGGVEEVLVMGSGHGERHGKGGRAYAAAGAAGALLVVRGGWRHVTKKDGFQVA